MLVELPVNIDAEFADDPDFEDVEEHQIHHDSIHAFYNQFDHTVDPENGFMWRWDPGEGKFVAVDPEIDGSPGDPGASAYEVAVANGFAGTEAQWLASLVYFHDQGNYSAIVTYHAGDGVFYSGNYYIGRATSTGSTPGVDVDGLPTTTGNWQAMASKGLNGADGDSIKGDKGDKGDDGPSAEAQSDQLVSGNVTVDASVATMWELEMTGNCVFTLDNGAALPAAGMEIRLYQGGSGTNTASFPNVTWITPDTGDGPGLPPALPTTVGDFIVLAFTYQPRAGWLGFVPALGVTVAPPPDTFGILALEEWVDDEDTTNRTAPAGGLVSVVLGATDVDGNTPQLGNKRGGLAEVVTTRNDSLDPPIPSLVGAGANWQLLATYTEGTGTNRRRTSLFGARDVVAGAASAFTIGLAEAVGAINDGFAIKAVRCAGIVSDTWLTLAAATAVVRRYNDAGETGSVPRVTLATDPQDAADRPVMFVSANLNVALTPEAGWAMVGSPLPMTAPTRVLWCVWNPDAYDNTATSALASSANWTAIACELEQGGAFTPPPAGFPPIDQELILVGFDTTDQTADYHTDAVGFAASVGNGASIIVGSARMGIVDVVTTTGTTVDPVEPTLSGGSMTTWDVAGTVVVGTGANRERTTRFIGWQPVAGAAAPFVVGVSGQATTGVQVTLRRTPTTDDATRDLAVANTHVRAYTDAGEAAAGPARIAAGDPLDAPDSTDSFTLVIATWRASFATLGTVTWEAGLTPFEETSMGSAPAVTMYAARTTTVFDTTPSATWTGGSIQWGIIATELGQAV